MEQLKYSLGPFELFAAIIGGSPFILAGFLMYNPVKSLTDLAQVIQSSGASGGAVAIALTMLFLSYIIGGTIQGLSWRYFLWLCRIFKKDYFYFGESFFDKLRASKQKTFNDTRFLEFEDRLVLQIRDKVGVPQKLHWIDSRMKAYLRECNSPAVGDADIHVASHIMYRNLSLGCLLLCGVSLVTAIRTSSLEFFWVALLVIFLAYLMFLRSVSFKRWQNRALILGFYFAVTKNADA